MQRTTPDNCIREVADRACQGCMSLRRSLRHSIVAQERTCLLALSGRLGVIWARHAIRLHHLDVFWVQFTYVGGWRAVWIRSTPGLA
jgi:hypothetical protein